MVQGGRRVEPDALSRGDDGPPAIDPRLVDIPPAERPGGLRGRLYTVIFESDTPAGRAFDILLIWVILASVGVVLLDSVAPARAVAGGLLERAEWVFTGVFTMEYALRLYCHPRRGSYAGSFFGVVDLLAVLPTYLALFFPGLHAFGVIRMFRLLRLFRIFKLLRYMEGARVLATALRNAQPKITIFLTTLAGIVVTLGALMYLIEGEESGFTSIPKGIYWAVITVTTVGYGDLVPRTVLGQALATFTMILGYSIIAVPTGIVSAEWATAVREEEIHRACPGCDRRGHHSDARFCADCGARLSAENPGNGL